MKSFLEFLESDGAIVDQEVKSIGDSISAAMARLKSLLQASPSSGRQALGLLDRIDGMVAAQRRAASQDVEAPPKAYTTNSDPWPKGQPILTPPTARG